MGYLKEVNIKSDMPSAETAIERVRATIITGKKLGAGAVKIIHGYGSSGRGGKIRTSVRKFLAELTDPGVITDYIRGEDFSIFSEQTRAAFLKCNDLRRDDDLERSNNGVTIIIL